MSKPDFKIEFFSLGKNEPKNEDRFDYSENSFVLSDGATDKTGLLFNGKTGGELIAQLVVTESLNTQLIGKDLADLITKKVVDLYKKINPEAITDSNKRSNATLVCVRIIRNKIFITQIGDTSFRINGIDLYKNDKIIDVINAKKKKLFYSTYW